MKDKEKKAQKKQKRKIYIWEFVKYFISILNTIAALASVLGVVISIVTKEYLSVAIYITVGIALLIVLFTVLAVRRSRKNDKMEEVKKYAKGFHEIAHLIRDCRKDLVEVIDDKAYKKPFHFRKYITEQVMRMMDALANNLSTATGYKVRVCVKAFYFAINGEAENNNLQLITLARSEQSNVKNMISEHYTTISVTENTDFEYIFNIDEGYVEERAHFFIADDLSKVADYKNSNTKWNKTYATTIVMPIRCLMNPKEDEQIEPYYDIIGFLCVDSKKKNLFSLENRGFVLDYLKGVADMLYVYLDECIAYHEFLEREKAND